MSEEESDKEDPFLGGSNEGFEQNAQSQNDENAQESIDDRVDEVSREDLEIKAEKDLAKDKANELYAKYMPGVDVNGLNKKEMKIQDIVREVDHLGLRLLEVKDVSEMSPVDRRKFEDRIAKTIQFYDALKKYTKLNVYSFRAGKFLGKANKIRVKLEDNLEVFQRELNGNSYQNDFSAFHDKILTTLPEYITADPKFSSAVSYLNQRSGKGEEETGLKALHRDLAQKARVQRDLDDLLGASISEYSRKLEELREGIGSINQELGANPGSKELVQERMEKNALYSTYVAEKDKLEDTQDRILDELLEIQAEYDLSRNQIDLREATMISTKETLRDLKAGIKQYETFVKSKKDVVVIGGHMMDVSYARGISDLINVGGFVAGQASAELLRRMTDEIREGTSIRGVGGEEIAGIKNDMQEYKRAKAESFKRQLDDKLYAA